MDYLGLFSRAWALIRRNKLLWLLGFLAALSGDVLSSVRIGPELSAGSLRANVLDVDGWARALRLLGGELVAATIFMLIAALGFLVAVLWAKAGLIDATRALSRQGRQERQEPFGLEETLKRAVRYLVPAAQATILLYVPYLLASDLAGELLRLSPGLLRLPVYAVLLGLLAVAVVLAVIHPLAICGIVLRGYDSRSSIEQAWAIMRGHVKEVAVIAGALLAFGWVLDGLAKAVLLPVAGTSLLSVLLVWSQRGLATIGQATGLLLLSVLATAIRAPAQLIGLVVLTLMYEEWAPDAKRING